MEIKTPAARPAIFVGQAFLPVIFYVGADLQVGPSRWPHLKVRPYDNRSGRVRYFPVGQVFLFVMPSVGNN